MAALTAQELRYRTHQQKARISPQPTRFNACARSRSVSKEKNATIQERVSISGGPETGVRQLDAWLESSFCDGFWIRRRARCYGRSNADISATLRLTE